MRGWTWSGVLGLAVLSVMGLAACGSGGADGNNDQGIVFRATGIFRGPENIDLDQIRCTEPTTENAIVDTSHTIDINTIFDFPNRGDPFADPCGGFIGLVNNLSQQAINVTEIVIEYEVPGAGIPIDPNSISFGQTILPALSPLESPSGQVNLIYAQLVGQILPRNTVVFLKQNANRLPGTPYLLNAFLVAKGQSEDGTRYTTNPIGYTFTIEG